MVSYFELHKGIASTPSSARARGCTVCAHSCTVTCNLKELGRLEARKDVRLEKRMDFFFPLLLAWMSSEKVHVLKMFSSEKQAYLSVVV